MIVYGSTTAKRSIILEIISGKFVFPYVVSDVKSNNIDIKCFTASCLKNIVDVLNFIDIVNNYGTLSAPLVKKKPNLFLAGNTINKI